MATSARVQRVADEIQKTIILLLATKVRDPRLKLISITGVDVSKDLSSAKVFFSSINDEVDVAGILKAFNLATGFFRTSIARSINLRVAPKLRFFYDDSLVYGSRMEKLIAKARESDSDFCSEDHRADISDCSSDTSISDDDCYPDGATRKRLR